jgi:hypothetical protein
MVGFHGQSRLSNLGLREMTATINVGYDEQFNDAVISRRPRFDRILMFNVTGSFSFK